MLIKNFLLPTLNDSPIKTTISPLELGKEIPKIIHQTFYKDVLPNELQANVEHIKKLNPDWEYRFYNDAAITDFIGSNFPPFVLNYFLRIDQRYGAARADFFRYLLMYRVGGVYLDIKSSVTKPFSDVFRSADKFLLSYWHNENGERHQGWGRHKELRNLEQGEFQQWHIVCAPGHPFLKCVIENVMANIDKYNPVLHGVGKHGVLRVTGPIAYTLAINKLIQVGSHRFVDAESDLGFQYSVYNSNSHVEIFKGHYSKLDFPVVTPRFLKRLVNLGYTSAALGKKVSKTMLKKATGRPATSTEEI